MSSSGRLIMLGVGFTALLQAVPMIEPGQVIFPAAFAQARPHQSHVTAQAPGANLAHNDVAYLERLGEVRGHLLVGVALYRDGYGIAARTHMKHPADELILGLAPAFAFRGVTGLDAPLETLASLIEKNAPLREVEAAYARLDEALQQMEKAAYMDGRTVLRAVAALIAQAGHEYEEAVQGGQVKNAHEYQDAYGFTQAAKVLLTRLSVEERRKAGASVTLALREIAGLAPAWPSLAGAGPIKFEADAFAGAARRIERAVPKRL